MFDVSLVHLLVTHVRYDINWEVFDKLCEVSSDVGYRYIERSLQLHKPVSVGDLGGREVILMLGHLRECVHVTYLAHGNHVAERLRLHHQALVGISSMHKRTVLRVN